MVNPSGIEYRCINKLFKFEDYNKYLLKLKRIFRKEDFMKSVKIFICGHFGYKKNVQIGGQHAKTRQLRNAIISKIGEENVSYVDTAFIKSNPLATLRKIKKNFIKSHSAIILPGKNGLRFLLPIFIILKNKFNTDLRYVVIGGWLSEFLIKRKMYLNLCKKFNGIYVETELSKKKLLEIGLNNVFVLPNFRQINFINNKIEKVMKPFKLVYFSRIDKEKGIELAIEVVNKINKNKKEEIIKLDIYGPIQDNYQDDFMKILNKCKDFISYKGYLEPNNIYKVLSKYDLMIFPTFCRTECFPGAIIDSYISGVPVLASNWLYSGEIIKENITGKLFVSQDIQDLTNKLEFLINNPDLIYKMKKNCLEEAKKYDADFVVESLIQDINLALLKNNY